MALAGCVVLDIAIFYADSRGRPSGDIWETLTMNLRGETYRRVQKEGIPFSAFIPLRVPNPMLKVVVYDYGSDRIGSQVVRVR